MLKAVLRAGIIGTSAFAFAAASPSVVAMTTNIDPESGPAMVQTPTQGGTAPLHVAGNAGTGDASRHTRGGIKVTNDDGTPADPAGNGETQPTADTADPTADTVETVDTVETADTKDTADTNDTADTKD